MALPNLGGLRLGPEAAGAAGAADAEATAGPFDDYELYASDDDYARVWDRAALQRVATPSANQEHWYEGHRGEPKSGLTVATVRYFGAHARSDYHRRDAAKVVSAELIVHGWHMKGAPPFSAGHANPALAWLVELKRVSARAASADARPSVRPYFQGGNRDSLYGIDSAHRAPGCDADDGECAVPQYELLDHDIHAQLVQRLQPEDPKDVRVRSMQVGEHAQFGYLLQMEVPEALASNVYSKTDGDPIVVFEPMVRRALATILFHFPANYERGLLFRPTPPARTRERTAEYLDAEVGPNNYVVHEYGLLAAPEARFQAALGGVMGTEDPWVPLSKINNGYDTEESFVDKVRNAPLSVWGK